MELLVTYLSLIGIVLIGGFIVIALKNNVNKGLKYILAFSGAFLLATSVMHIIPEVYESSINKIGVFVLIGFLLQLFLEFFSQGIEHGHIHVHGSMEKSFPIVIMLSLCIHSFLEGFPLVREIGHDLHGHAIEHLHEHNDQSLLYGILLHKLPISIALMSMFLKAKLKVTNAFLWLLLFAVMAPLGTFVGDLFKEDLLAYTGFFDAVLAIVLGMFLHISTTILFESDESHKFNFVKLLLVVGGGTLAYFAS